MQSPMIRSYRLGLESLESRDVMTITFTDGALSVFGTAGVDQIELFGRGVGIVDVIEFPGDPVRTFTGVTSVLVDSGADNDAIKLEFVTPPATLIAGSGNDRIQYKRESEGAVNLTIDAGAGSDEIEVDLKTPINFSSTPITDNIAINSGAEDDKLNVQTTSESAVYNQMVNLTDPSGNHELLYQMDQKSQLGNSRLNATLIANMGSGLDKINVKVESESQTSNFSMSGGGTSGMKEINAEVIFDGAARDASVSYNLTTGGDMDKIGLKTLSQASRSLIQSQTINTGNGNDVVNISINQIGTSTSTATATVTSNVNMGDGNDEFGMEYAGEFSDLTLHGTITSGLADDKVQAIVKARTLVNNLILLGGGGTDFVEFLP